MCGARQVFGLAVFPFPFLPGLAYVHERAFKSYAFLLAVASLAVGEGKGNLPVAMAAVLSLGHPDHLDIIFEILAKDLGMAGGASYPARMDIMAEQNIIDLAL